METLKERTARSMYWSTLNNGVIQLLNIAFGIFLGRLLTPADYGIVGVLTIFTLIAGNLQSSGFTQGLINLKQPTSNDYNSVFWFNVIASLVIYGVLFACAPLISRFFNEPRLTTLSRFVFLGFLISSLGIAQAAYMAKNMMNREIAIINGIALLLSGIAGVSLAYMGMAYWSLAWQQVLYITILNIGRYHYSPWRPNLRINFGPVKSMFGFSVKILFTNILNTLSNNVLTFIFGRYFAMRQVGNFTQANKWSTMGHSFVSGTLSQVAQTVLVEAGDETEHELRVFRKMMRFTALLSFPAMFGLALVAHEFILLTIGPKWIDSIVLLQVLCVAGAFMPLYAMYQNLAISCRRSDIYMWLNIAQIVLQIAVIMLFKSQGLTVMVIAYSIFMVVWLVVWQIAAHRLIGLRLIDTMKDVLPFMLTAAAVMVVTHYSTLFVTNMVLRLVARVALAALLYVVVMKAAHVTIMDECIEFIKRKFVKTHANKEQ